MLVQYPEQPMYLGPGSLDIQIVEHSVVKTRSRSRCGYAIGKR